VRITLIAVGKRMPAWVSAGVEDYQRRLGSGLRFELKEIAPAKPALREQPDRIKADEAGRIAAAIPAGARVVALDERGELWSSRELSTRLAGWMQAAPEVVWLVGGSDGLQQELLDQAHECWSLSRLTLPHALVRVVLAEQLYRAESLLRGHPYHRD
jgi:23S rRNA (pseudouridine1915-N3)-methyltransferase